MNAVGIDVSKGKSMVAALRPMGEVALPPQEFLHTEVGLEKMACAIIALGEDTRVVMEATGRYHEPVAAALHEYGRRVLRDRLSRASMMDALLWWARLDPNQRRNQPAHLQCDAIAAMRLTHIGGTGWN